MPTRSTPADPAGGAAGLAPSGVSARESAALGAIAARCILCGADDAVPVLVSGSRDRESPPPERFQLVRCRRCTLHFLHPQPDADTLKTYYPEDYYAYTQTELLPITIHRTSVSERLGWWTKRGIRRAFHGYPCPGGVAARWALRLVLWPLWIRMRLLGKDLKVLPYHGAGRLLELGCGAGSSLDYQRFYGFQVTGVEPSAAAARVARTRYGLEVRVGALEDARFPERSFDVAHLSHVFEHLSDPVATLRELHRVLEPEGLLVLKLPNIAGVSAGRFGPFWLGLDLPRHLYHFSPETITALLQRHGFAVRAIRHDVGSWGFWRESRRLQHRHAGGGALREAWWRDWVDQAAETRACWRGAGSTMVVYAQKTSRAWRRAIAIEGQA